MNSVAKWGIIIGVGILGVLILIGLIGLLIKFFMKRCRRRAWDDINSLPKQVDSSENIISRRQIRGVSSEREPLVPTTTDISAVSDGHMVIPIDSNEIPDGRNQYASTANHDHTIVQIQRDRLNHLKEEENRVRPMLRLSTGELDIQRAIDLAQKEFDESV